MRKFEAPIELTPRQFELAVKGILDAACGGLESYESKHLEKFSASDGDYEIDVTARFNALGANFLVLVECKHHKRKIERQDVQVLDARIRSMNAHKGMIFSTSGFQAGAISYADEHGIALVRLVDGKSNWFTKSYGSEVPPPPWVRFSEYIGWWCHGSSMSLMSDDHVEYTRIALGLSADFVPDT
ncbi:restriction endonuclease [Pseudoxanthomonas sp. PXM02]|uniref:restriction endonuclease n=1 Tax=Pseudoxanthomonas sp. PXM02 TaxID=2769294 RepID=UPI001786B8A9|nr:restriction endonuclease [Pseudoxanthomonas sp. PXM02]MBD9478868.1 restriction endonuclease [Pseudoxanthomonas sp. PXM02]